VNMASVFFFIPSADYYCSMEITEDQETVQQEAEKGEHDFPTKPIPYLMY